MSKTADSSTTYYKAWNCSSCGRKGMNAYWCKQCPRCGSAKELDDRKEEEYETATEVGPEYEFKGVDCMCDACGTDNKKRFSCRNCGKALDPKFEKQVTEFTAASDDAWRNRHVLEGTVNASGNEVPKTSLVPGLETNSQIDTPRYIEEQRSLPVTSSLSGAVRWQLIAVIIAIVIGLLIGGYWLFAKSQERHLTAVTALHAEWTYSLSREQYGPQDDSRTVAEGSSFVYPSNAYHQNQMRVFSQTQDVTAEVWTTDGCSKPYTDSRDNGDGTTTVETGTETYDCYLTKKVGEVDRYNIVYSWTVDEWHDITPQTARGVGQNPEFPVFRSSPTLRAKSEPDTTFTITYGFGDNGSTFVRTLPRPLWEQIEIGHEYDALRDGLGRFVTIELIDPPSSFN